MDKLKVFSFLIKSLSLICFTLSCDTEVPKPRSGSVSKRNFVCQTKGPGCWQFSECMSFCDDLFFKEEKRKKCYNWPMPLFEDFKNLTEAMSRESFRYLELEVLKCFLEFTEDDKDILFEKFNEEEAKEFLEEVAGDGTLAFYLAEKDKGDFSILNTLFKKINSRTERAVGEPLFEKNNFLILVHQQDNRPAWVWLNDYIIYQCRRDRSCKEPLDYYCKILENVNFSILEDFFENQHFQREYERRIESKTCNLDNCSYGDLRDFNEMCDNI